MDQDPIPWSRVLKLARRGYLWVGRLQTSDNRSANAGDSIRLSRRLRGGGRDFCRHEPSLEVGSSVIRPPNFSPPSMWLWVLTFTRENAKTRLPISSVACIGSVGPGLAPSPKRGSKTSTRKRRNPRTL